MLNYCEGDYLYAICMDFEATCWEKTFLTCHERATTDRQEIIGKKESMSFIKKIVKRPLKFSFFLMM